MTLRLLRAARMAPSLMRLARSAPGEARRLLGEDLQLDGGVERLVAGVHLEDGAATADVGAVEHHVAVEATGAEQRGIEDVGAVGGGDDDDVRGRLEAVHLDEQLVERLLALVVTAAEAGAALAADGVDLIDEDDAGRVLLGLVEQVAHAAGADPDEHLDELRAADAEERHAGLAGHRLAEECLAGPGRTDQEDALGDARADRRELVGVLEELDDLRQLLLGLLDAGDVGERDGRLVTGEQAGAAPSEGHRLVVAALRLPEDPEQEERHQPEEDEVWQEDAQEEVAPAAGVVAEIGVAIIGEDLEGFGTGADSGLVLVAVLVVPGDRRCRRR